MITALAIWILAFVAVAYVAYWVCEKFHAPAPVFWVVAILLLIILLNRIAGLTGFHLP